MGLKALGSRLWALGCTLFLQRTLLPAFLSKQEFDFLHQRFELREELRAHSVQEDERFL